MQGIEFILKDRFNLKCCDSLLQDSKLYNYDMGTNEAHENFPEFAVSQMEASNWNLGYKILLEVSEGPYNEGTDFILNKETLSVNSQQCS